MTAERKGILMGHINIRSLWQKIDVFRTTFADKHFSIIGLSETWLTQNYDDSILNLDGYILYRLDRTFYNNQNHIKKGGGVCLYIREEIDVKLSTVEHLSNSSQNIECQWVELCFEKQRNIIVGNMYRPPQGDVEIFIKYVEGCIEEIDLSKKDVYIFGDVNIDALDKNHDSTKKLVEFLSQTGLTNYIRKPTRYTTGRNSCLDHIYSNSTKVASSGILYVNI